VLYKTQRQKLFTRRFEVHRMRVDRVGFLKVKLEFIIWKCARANMCVPARSRMTYG